MGRPAWITVRRRALSRHEAGLVGERMDAPGTVARLLGPRLAPELAEVMVVVCLTGQMRVLALVEVARGGVAGLALQPADVLRPVICAGAPAFVLAHNHPGGDPTPSAEDVDTTARLVTAARTVGVELVDHVVIAPRLQSPGPPTWVSMLEAGTLKLECRRMT